MAEQYIGDICTCCYNRWLLVVAHNDYNSWLLLAEHYTGDTCAYFTQRIQYLVTGETRCIVHSDYNGWLSVAEHQIDDNGVYCTHGLQWLVTGEIPVLWL